MYFLTCDDSGKIEVARMAGRRDWLVGMSYRDRFRAAISYYLGLVQSQVEVFYIPKKGNISSYTCSSCSRPSQRSPPSPLPSPNPSNAPPSASSTENPSNTATTSPTRSRKPVAHGSPTCTPRHSSRRSWGGGCRSRSPRGR